MVDDTPEKNFDEQSNPIATGARLRAIRQEKGHSEADIEQRLNIKQRIVTAIEEHDYDTLPDTITVSALVRQYANFLGLDGQTFGNNYKYEMSGTDQKIEVVFPDRLPSSFKPFRNAIPFTLCIVAACFIWNYYSELDGLLPEMPSSTEISKAVSGDNSVTTQNDDVQKVVKEVKKNEILKPELTIKPNIHFQVIRDPKIVLEAYKGKSWVQIKDPDNRQVIYAANLSTGQSFRIPNYMKSLRLKAGNSGPLRITINGQKIGILPKQSQVLRNFKIDPDYLIRYYTDQE